MGRKKKVPMDKLALDMIQCKKDGFGVHYGAWRAAQYEKNKGMTPPAKPKGYKHTCLNCGKEFYSKCNNNRKYCSEQCKNSFYRSQSKECKPNEITPAVKKPVEKNCPICGKNFIAESYRNKYCSPFCVKVAMGESVKRYQARKAEEAKANG